MRDELSSLLKSAGWGQYLNLLGMMQTGKKDQVCFTHCSDEGSVYIQEGLKGEIRAFHAAMLIPEQFMSDLSAEINIRNSKEDLSDDENTETSAP